MTQISEPRPAGHLARLMRLAVERRALMVDYATAMSGTAGRLVFSLVYFVALANTLSVAEFGMFATASAAGVLISRLYAFGFTSVLYRIATVRPRLIGTFTAGYLALAALSLPLLLAASALLYLAVFSNQMGATAFALVIAAEVLLWRPAEAVMIVNNGMGRFGSTTIIIITAMLFRSAGAVALALMPVADLIAWCWIYLATNAASLAFAAVLFYPRQRLRFRRPLYVGRIGDSLSFAGAETLFYLQMDFDKMLVLTFGGPHLAGIYAIIMRLVDLTAIPIRTFTMMLVQKIMRVPDLVTRMTTKIGLEAGVFAVSTAALAALSLLLHVWPGLLGGNVAEAAPLLWLVLLVPGFRNLVEYQAELLFARGQVKIRALNLALLAGGKAVLLVFLLSRVTDAEELALWLNAAFALLYAGSAALTYSAMRLPQRRA